MPSRGRALAEATVAAAALFAPGWTERETLRIGLVATVVVAALLVTRPWHLHRQGRSGAAALAFVALVCGITTLGFLRVGNEPSRPRLGVMLQDAAPFPGCGTTEVTAITPGSPADGVLRTGDRICRAAGDPLEAHAPMADLMQRVRSGEVPGGPVVFTVIRGDRPHDVTVHLPPAARPPRSGLAARVIAQDVAIILVVLGVALASGQSWRHLGLVRDGALRDAIAGIPAAFGTLIVNLTAGVALAAAYTAARGLLVLQAEARTRIGTLGEVADQLEPVSLAVLVGVLVAVSEELCFRGLILPRVRVATGGWTSAVLLTSLVFGWGHLYQGPLATAQTAVLGAWFSILYLRRGRLLTPIVAHGLFNATTFGLLAWFRAHGGLESLGR